jgi:hypothetical protein
MDMDICPTQVNLAHIVLLAFLATRSLGLGPLEGRGIRLSLIRREPNGAHQDFDF